MGPRGQGVGRPLDAPRVCVFGEIRLRHGECEVPITGKPARVLAALISSRAGLSLAQLLDTVWPTAPPKSARAALHVHLGTLRKLLAGVPNGPCIERFSAGYRIQLNGWDVDVDLFHRLADEAHELLEADPASACRLASQALMIGSGSPFTIDGEPLFVSVTSQLDVARRDLEESLIEALIASGQLGRAETLVHEMIETEPFRERRWSQLMRIQMLEDRAADALRTFQRARRRFVEDLGIDPGPELQALERAVLTRSVASTTSESEPTDDFDDIPSTPGPIIGRILTLKQIETSMSTGLPVVLLGAPGVGKTRLAIEVARTSVGKDRRSKWIDLRNAQFGDHRLEHRLVDWARRNPNGLVVVDNAENELEELNEVLPILRRLTPDVDVLITSRVPVTIDAAVVIVGPLSLPGSDRPDDIERAESVLLLRSMLAMFAPDVDMPVEAAAALCRRSGGLPLVIKLTAELTRAVPPSVMARRDRVDRHSEIDSAVHAVLDQLGSERAAFLSLSVVAGPQNSRSIAALTGDEKNVDGLIRRLVEYGLLQCDVRRTDAPYSILEPLRDTALGMLTVGARHAALDRLADYCIHLAEGSKLPTATTRDGDPLRLALARELTWHRQSLAHLTAIGDDQRALELVAALELALYGLGWWRTNTELQDAALAIPGPASPLRARVHVARGRPGLLHQFAEDHLDAAVAMADQVGDVATAAKATLDLGILRWWQGRLPEALDLLEEARRMADRCNDCFVATESQRFAGVALVCAGEEDRGFALQLGVLRRVERSRGMALLVPHIRMYLGHCRRHVGDDAAAIADLQHARREYEQIGNRASLIHVCSGLAELYADHEDHDQALRLAGRALEVSAVGQISAYDPWVLCTIARVHASQGDAVGARAAGEAAANAVSTSWIGEVHRVAVELAGVCLAIGDSEAAARLIGVADGNSDRRELPFRPPAEEARFADTRAATQHALGADFARLYQLGKTSTVSESLARLATPLP